MLTILADNLEFCLKNGNANKKIQPIQSSPSPEIKHKTLPIYIQEW